MHTLKIGDVTITSIIERDGPWRQPRGHVPRLRSGNRPALPRRDGPGGVRRRVRPHGDHLSDLRRAHAAAHHPGGYLHRRGQGLSGADGLSQAALAGRIPRRGAELRGRSTTCSARICTSTIAAGTRCCATGAGCRPFRRRNTCSTSANTRRGRRRRSVATIRRAMSGVSTASRSSRPGQALLVDDDYTLDDTVWLTPTPGHSPCHCCVNIKSGGQRAVGDRRHDASRAAMPRAGLVHHLRLGREGGGGVAAEVPERGGRHRHADPADPFPVADGRAGDGGRRAVPLQFRAVR